MSLVRHKKVFDAALAELPAELRRELWRKFADLLVAEAGGSSLNVPTSVRDPELEQRQGELFEQRAAGGQSLREIAREMNCSKDRVHRHLSQTRIGVATAA